MRYMVLFVRRLGFAAARLRQSAVLPFFTFFALSCCAVIGSAAAAPQSGETRALKIYFVHTHEREEVVFKKNGRYLRSGLRRLDYLLRDWRRNEATNMDPRLFDLVWQIYRLSGSKEYIHAVSGYRSPQTNAMLRLSSPASGVAKHSRHMQGKAMDFYLPDVNLAYLRAIALKLQGGGIGYYPGSGSPFVHVDVGTVRHWPRMSHRALAALFPDGFSLHVPANGRPLAHYALALGQYRQRGGAPLSAVSARQLFGGLSSRQIILAAADGRLPHLLGSAALDRRGLDGSLPPQAPLLMVEAAPPRLGLSGFIPVPAAPPLRADEAAEAQEDEADVAAAPVPVPLFKRDAVKQPLAAHYRQKGREGRPAAAPDEIGELLAYAPVPRAENGGFAALQALGDSAPLPAAKPVLAGQAGAAGRGAQALPPHFETVPLPAQKPLIGARGAMLGRGLGRGLGALAAEAAFVPRPRFKPLRRD